MKMKPANAGSIILRDAIVLLDSDIGKAFIVDCARHTELLISEQEIKAKWGMSGEHWAELAHNVPLLQAVRSERGLRIASGATAREAACRLFATAPNILGDILSDALVSPRHRIEAAKELRAVATVGRDVASEAGEKFTITINIGEDKPRVFEANVLPNDGELT